MSTTSNSNWVSLKAQHNDFVIPTTVNDPLNLNSLVNNRYMPKESLYNDS